MLIRKYSHGHRGSERYTPRGTLTEAHSQRHTHRGTLTEAHSQRHTHRGTLPEAQRGTLPEAHRGTHRGTLPEAHRGTHRGTLPEAQRGTLPEAHRGTLPEAHSQRLREAHSQRHRGTLPSSLVRSSSLSSRHPAIATTRCRHTMASPLTVQEALNQGINLPAVRCESLRAGREADAQAIFNAPLPIEVVLHIFSYLSPCDLTRVASVSWAWNILSSHDSLYVLHPFTLDKKIYRALEPSPRLIDIATDGSHWYTRKARSMARANQAARAVSLPWRGRRCSSTCATSTCVVSLSAERRRRSCSPSGTPCTAITQSQRCTDLMSRSIVFYHVLSCSIMFYHVLSGSAMIDHVLS